MDWKTEFDDYFEDEKYETTNAALLLKDGTLYCFENTACHAELSCCQEFAGQIDRIISRPTYESEWEDEELLLFAKYMLYESPWKDLFLNTSPEDVLDNYWHISPEHNAEMVANAAIATRLISEFPDRFAIFKNLYQKGMTGTEAYLCSILFRGEDSYYFYPADGHSISLFSSDNTIKRFLTHSPFYKRDNTYQEVGHYNDNNSVWDEGKGYGHSKKVRLIRNFKGYEVKKVKNLNIFYKERVDSDYNYFSMEQFPSILQQVKEKFIA